MRKLKTCMVIKYVAQEHYNGCGIACIAMVLGLKYKDVNKQFLADFDKKGLSAELIRSFICEHGFSVVEKIAHGFMDVRASNKRMLEPFAPIHILHVQPQADAKMNHSIVMDEKGRVYDPKLPQVRDSNGLNIYYVCRVAGFWPETPPKRKK